MRKERFDQISEDELFWLPQTDAPENPHDFYGPYKKKIYLEFSRDVPEFVFVRVKRESLRDQIIVGTQRYPRSTRPN
jgi:hypothetical protein